MELGVAGLVLVMIGGWLSGVVFGGQFFLVVVKWGLEIILRFVNGG